MSKNQGKFVWYELATTDVKGAIDFYRNVIGWQTDFYEGAGMPYNILKADSSNGIGGVFELPEEARKNGAPPHWTAYVYADDVDALTKKAVSLGGTSCVPPSDIPTVGRFSVIADPHGAMIALLKPLGPDSQEEETEMPPPKHFCWRELMGGSLDEDFAFYAELFGWEKHDAMPMPNGVYQLYGRDGKMLGGMMTKPDDYPYRPHWLYYVAVADLDASLALVTKHGGKIMMGPMEVPGGTRVAQCFDPQGAMFALNGA
jgi:predicted enzyme related to lactoylglutathione lyase